MDDADLDTLDTSLEASRPRFIIRMLYFLIALFVTLPPVYLYWSIFGMSVEENLHLFAVVVFSSAIVVSLAYHNVSFYVRHREKLGKNEARALKEQQSFYTALEAGAFSVLYNNLFFLLITVFLGFFVLTSFTPEYNYVLSSLIAAAALSMTSAKTLGAFW